MSRTALAGDFEFLLNWNDYQTGEYLVRSFGCSSYDGHWANFDFDWNDLLKSSRSNDRSNGTRLNGYPTDRNSTFSYNEFGF